MSGGGKSNDDLLSLEARASSEGKADSFDELLEAAVRPSEGSSPAGLPSGHFARLSIRTKVSDRFVVEWYAGGGGMGDLYRCCDLTSQDVVALKVIRRLGDHARFRREAAILSSLSHEAIVRYIAHGVTDDGTPFLAMDWLDGEDLARRLRRNRLTVVDTLQLARRVCSALTIAHARGFIHRDIKPSNIFLCGSRPQDAKLIDFGVAHRGASAQTATRAGTVLGTVGYMAPEQASGLRGTDPSDDLFSLGCVLFECLTGRPAFSGESAVAVLEAVLHGEPPDVRSLQPDVPDDLAELVQSLLRKKRTERPRSAAAVLDAVEQIALTRHSRVRVRSERNLLLWSPIYRAYLTGRASSAAELDADARRFGASRVPAHDDTLLVLEPRTLQLLDFAAQARRLAAAASMHCQDVNLSVLAGTDSAEDLSAALCDLRASASEKASDRFVGRELELATLNAIFAETEGDEVARAVLITGAAGLGKSALAAAFLDGCRHADIVTVDAVPEQLAVEGSLLRDLTRVWPERLPPLDRLSPAGLARPLIVCIDDAQWADLTSMRAIVASVALRADSPLLLLGVARFELSAPARELWRQTGCHNLQLRGLNPRACRRLLEESGSDAEALAPLAQTSVRLLLAAVRARQSYACELAALALFRETVLQLDDDERDLLCKASLLNDRFSAAELTNARNAHAPHERELARLCSAGLLKRRDDSGEPGYTFTLSLIRDAAAGLIDATPRTERVLTSS